MSQDILPPQTHMGYVALDVRDLGKMIQFYHHIVGLDILSQAQGKASLGRIIPGLPQGNPIVFLTENRNLPLRPSGSAGLFHTAILFDDPTELAAAVIRIAQHVPHLFTGTGDHAVSEAFYLDDPEGNGVELYVDRPQASWKWGPDGVYMTTEYIDPRSFIESHRPSEATVNQEGDLAVNLGHVHLQVGDIDSASTFYVDVLGFEQTSRMGNSALFVSAGRYHHHMAMNTWGSAGAGLRAPSLGMGRVEILVPDGDALGAATDRLTVAQFPVNDDGRAIETRDPWGNTVVLSQSGDL